jgi:hypothetical protein
MERRLILRGLLAGAAGGLLAFVFARIFAEPQIQTAIEYEHGRAAAQAALGAASGVAAEVAGSEPFSRAVQGNAGLGLALILFGTAMGALFAVVYTMCLGRAGRLRARPLAVLLAAGAFLGMYLVPFLKYPVNPPAVGEAETIRMRSGLYLLMVGCSVVLLLLAVWSGRRLRVRFGSWNATLLGAAVFVAAVGLLMLVLPSVGDLGDASPHRATETPLPLLDASGRMIYPGFPADVLFDFRLASLGTQLIMWAAIGLIFGPLAERLLEPARPGREAVAAGA